MKWKGGTLTKRRHNHKEKVQSQRDKLFFVNRDLAYFFMAAEIVQIEMRKLCSSYIILSKQNYYDYEKSFLEKFNMLT